ncbi:MAG: magnesium chelatase subunit [Actinomycetota bacterium]|nr:magnesium chelatase subunit [Actinomycetota bacterium]
MKRPVYPFAALVGQERLRLGLLLSVVSPSLSGILVRGEKGTAKSTAVRALADLLPTQRIMQGCPFRLSPEEHDELCPSPPSAPCRSKLCRSNPHSSNPSSSNLEVATVRVPVVELPVGATEDRVAGTIDLERALQEGVRGFEPGLLAAAHRGILYVDEVNLLDDHVVDLLLDSAAMGVNTVEREGISLAHPARFRLVGTMNPEEGELRPQLLDRFGLCVSVEGSQDPLERVEIMRRRSEYEQDPEGFADRWADEQAELAERLDAARRLLPEVKAGQDVLLRIATVCLDAGVDGHRGDLTLLRASTALAAWRGRDAVVVEDIEEVGELVLSHRRRRLPLQEIATGAAPRPGGDR